MSENIDGSENIDSCNINLENDYKLSTTPIEYNKFLLKKELTERKCLAQQQEDKNGFLYPNLNDINLK